MFHTLELGIVMPTDTAVYCNDPLTRFSLTRL